MQALVEQWIEFATGELDAPLASWYYPIAGYMEYNKKVGPTLLTQSTLEDLNSLRMRLLTAGQLMHARCYMHMRWASHLLRVAIC